MKPNGLAVVVRFGPVLFVQLVYSQPEHVDCPSTQHLGDDVSQQPKVPFRRVALGSIIASQVRFVMLAYGQVLLQVHPVLEVGSSKSACVKERKIKRGVDVGVPFVAC